jgi:hypothetical protein
VIVQVGRVGDPTVAAVFALGRGSAYPWGG